MKLIFKILFFEHLSAQIDKKLVPLPVKEEGRVYFTRGATLVDALRPLGSFVFGKLPDPYLIVMIFLRVLLRWVRELRYYLRKVLSADGTLSLSPSDRIHTRHRICYA